MKMLFLNHLHFEGIVNQTFYIIHSSNVANQQVSSNRNNRFDFNRRNGPNKNLSNIRHLHFSLSHLHLDSQQSTFNLPHILQYLNLHTFLQQISFFQQISSSQQFPLSHLQAMRKKLQT